MNSVDASIILPVYNQNNALFVTLNCFLLQTYPLKNFEVIIVDDGSSESIKDDAKIQGLINQFPNINIVSQRNQGRAVSRNNGAAEAKGRYLIFCDADRFPDENFVRNHINSISQNENSVIIGLPWEYYGKMNVIVNNTSANWDIVKKYSRYSNYFSKISSIYDHSGNTESGIAWSSLMIGNSSMTKENFENCNGFDNNFKTWGFEHFELGYRLQKNNTIFRYNKEIANYHIQHPRGESFYDDMMDESIKVLINKYPEKNMNLLREFLAGKISLQAFEFEFSGKISKTIENTDEILFSPRLSNSAMSEKMKDVLSKVAEIVRNNIESARNVDINADTNFIDIGIDSIELMSLIVYVEEEFDFVSDETDVLIYNFSKFNKIGDIANYILKKLN